MTQERLTLTVREAWEADMEWLASLPPNERWDELDRRREAGFSWYQN